MWHPATEPVSAAEVYEYLTDKKFVNELGGTPADYDYRTIHAEAFGGKNGYPKTGKTPTKISFFKGNSELMKMLIRNAIGAYKPSGYK